MSVNESEGNKVIKTSDAKMKLEGGRPFLGYSVSNGQGSLRPLAKHFFGRSHCGDGIEDALLHRLGQMPNSLMPNSLNVAEQAQSHNQPVAV